VKRPERRCAGRRFPARPGGDSVRLPPAKAKHSEPSACTSAGTLGAQADAGRIGPWRDPVGAFGDAALLCLVVQADAGHRPA